MGFQKGVSANPGGRAQNRPITDAIKRAIAQDDGKRLRLMAEKVLDMAAEGDPWACGYIADRIEGKPIQQQVHAGDEEGGPVRHMIQVVYGKNRDDADS